MAYSGLVRATENCFIDGTRYSCGQTFEVAEHWLSPTDPFEPVRLIGYEPVALHGPERREVAAPIYETVRPTAAALNQLNRAGWDAIPRP